MRAGKKRVRVARKPAPKSGGKGDRNRVDGPGAKANSPKGKQAGKAARRTGTSSLVSVSRRAVPKKARETKGSARSRALVAAKSKTVRALSGPRNRPRRVAVSREAEESQLLTKGVSQPLVVPEVRAAEKVVGTPTGAAGSAIQEGAPPLPIPIASFTI